MVDGRWWPMADDGWWTVDGGWSTADGEWTMTDGGWTMVYGVWSMVDGRWSLADARYSIFDVQCSMHGVPIRPDDEHRSRRFTVQGFATQLTARMLAVSCVANPGTVVRAIAGLTKVQERAAGHERPRTRSARVLRAELRPAPSAFPHCKTSKSGEKNRANPSLQNSIAIF
jgi:hypothetical protein